MHTSCEDKPATEQAISRVRQFVREQQLWHTGASLLLAVSGGPDSVTLLDILTTLAIEDDLTLIIAHINHSLREEATADAAFVQKLADRYDIPFLYAVVDVPKHVAATGKSIEEAARELRYASLHRFADEQHCDFIVTGHTADDQAETVLMRMLRGTGLAGLAGIPPKREAIIRPLLTLRRQDIEAYLAAKQLPSRLDTSNLTTDFTRNRIRLELIPKLETEFAPRLRTRLNHLAEMARQENDALDQWTNRAYMQQRIALPDGVAILPNPDIPQAIQWRMWRRAIADVCGSLEDISYEHIDAIHHLIPGKHVDIPGVRVLHEAGRLVFLAATNELYDEQRIPTALRLSVPGQLSLPDAGSFLFTELFPTKIPVAGGNIAVMDADAIDGELIVRSWQPGDRYRPFGSPGTRKLQDIFVDAGVPRRLRNNIPVVLDDKGIIWLAGFRPADRVKIDLKTVRSLRITIEWELNPWTLKRSNKKLPPN
ncbi:MAG TPA: tRNA lysidine(34) synthetase TilS [Armatimonadota bacterium]|nr:tRNA lysidine(34) synthetase TilS [Armatimonadota bacterium]